MPRIQSIVLVSILSTAAVDAHAGGPTPPKQAKDIQCLVGEWKGTGTLEAGGDRVPIALSYECKPAAGGFGLSCGGTITGIPELDRYEFVDIWGFDPGDGLVHWYTVTNTGETHDHRGKLGKDRFKGRFTGKRDGVQMVEDVQFVFKNKETMEVSWVVTIGGKETEQGKVDAHKERTGAKTTRR